MRLLRQRDISGTILLKPERSEGVKNLLLINPLTGELYIPGSYLKDAMHAILMEKFPDQPDISLLFGGPSPENDEDLENNAPMRLVVRDALPDEKMAAMLQEAGKEARDSRALVSSANEVLNNFYKNPDKTLEFELHMGVRIYDDCPQKEDELVNCTIQGLKCMENANVKGLGQVAFSDLRLDDELLENWPQI